MAMLVGIKAHRNSLMGLIPSTPKLSPNIPNPAGLGAFAITVNPPPETAPATRAMATRRTMLRG